MIEVKSKCIFDSRTHEKSAITQSRITSIITNERYNNNRYVAKALNLKIFSPKCGVAQNWVENLGIMMDELPTRSGEMRNRESEGVWGVGPT